MLTLYPEIINTDNNIKLKSSLGNLCTDALDLSLTELREQIEKDLSEVYEIKW